MTPPDEELRKAVALFRYGLIADVCGFRSNPITESGASRSPIPIQPDH